MKKSFLSFSILALLAFASLNVSCSRDDDFGVQTVQKSEFKLTLSGGNFETYKEVVVKITEVNTGKVIEKQLENTNVYTAQLPFGSYKITANGTVVTTAGEEVQVGGTLAKDINTTTVNVVLPLQIKQFNNDFIIEEVFFTGLKTTEGKRYNNSRYFKITNNTDSILYADGLIIASSEFFTTRNKYVTPYHPDEAFAISDAMVVPGNGQQYPVEPGDFIVVADNAIDHTASNGFDLRNADFEFPNDNPHLGQVDNPEVPNMNIFYTEMTYNMIFLYTTSQETYVIARFPDGENVETFLANHKYDYSYETSIGTIKERSTYEIPNSWIVDAVNLSRENDFKQILTDPSIDAGWTSSTPGYNRKTVRRIVLGTMFNGKNLYKDTNNSTEDFVQNATPSLENGIPE